jgi:hypothetical protein
MAHDAPRSRAARAAAERALVRVVHHYGARPEFVILGGLVPELLCGGSRVRHAGTTDVDVQVDLEVAAGTVNAARLEQALRDADFEPDRERVWPERQVVWRWVDADSSGAAVRTVVKFELLADLDNEPAGMIVSFTDSLGAVNLRGTGFAARDIATHTLRAEVDGVTHSAEVNISGLGGFLLAKTAAAHSRRKPKDWYDIAFVLLHNDDGGPEAAADAVRAKFDSDLTGSLRTALADLCANFADRTAQGPQAYAEQMVADHPDLDGAILATDAVIAVETFYTSVRRP